MQKCRNVLRSSCYSRRRPLRKDTFCHWCQDGTRERFSRPLPFPSWPSRTRILRSLLYYNWEKCLCFLPGCFLNWNKKNDRQEIYRGYYTVARRYEFYVRVVRTISHSFAALTREILFLPREHKIHIFEPPCNVLFIIWRNQFNKSKRRE